MSDLPLLEFDPDEEGVLDPGSTRAAGVDAPVAAVGCFFPELLDALPDRRELMALSSLTPLWEIEWQGHRLAVFFPGMGAPVAAASLEDVIAAGCRNIVFCGGAGAVVPELALGHVVIPAAALRDEGTSFHYAPPSREIDAEAEVVSTLAEVCSTSSVPCTVGKVWTTDGPFRETRGKIARRRDEGCIVVEMEVSALLAVGRFRRVNVGALLYAADDVSGDVWDSRGWTKAVTDRQRVFDLSAAAAIALSERTAERSDRS
jgi:uridine phosphorylase